MEKMTVWTGGGRAASQVCGKTEHPEYNRYNLHRDIAVIQLCTQINFTQGKLTKTNTLPVKPDGYIVGVEQLYLPEEPEDPEDRPGLITSWRRLSSRSGLRSEVVREVSVRTVGQARCGRKYGGRYQISPSVICAQTDGQDFCHRDSWSSLTTVDQQGRHVLLGVTAWARRCSKPGYPGLYTFTRMAAIRDWLHRTMAPQGK